MQGNLKTHEQSALSGRRRSRMKKATFMVVFLVVMVVFGVGCDKKSQTPIQINSFTTEGEAPTESEVFVEGMEEIPTESEQPEGKLEGETSEEVGSLVIKGSLKNSAKSYSDAAVAYFVTEMARRVNQIDWRLTRGEDTIWGEARPNANGDFVFSINGLTTGQYQMWVSAGSSETFRQFFTWEENVTVSGGSQQVKLSLKPITTFETTIVVTNLPQTCSTGRVENGRCYLIDENGDAYEATTPDGSGCNIQREADGSLTLCAMAEFPLNAEITSVIVTDDYGFFFQTAYEFNCLDWIERNVGWATFPDEIILDVEIELDTEVPPTLYIETAEDGWDYAWLDCGNFVFSTGWELNGSGDSGFINPGCHIYAYNQGGLNEIATKPEEATPLSHVVFYIMWSCGPYERYIEDYSVRVIRNGVIISPQRDEQGNLFYGWSS